MLIGRGNVAIFLGVVLTALFLQSCTQKSVELASIADIFIEDAIDGSGNKVQALALKPGVEKTYYAIKRNSDGSFIESVAVSWSISNTIANITTIENGKGVTLTTTLAGQAIISAIKDSQGNEISLLVGVGPNLSISTSTTDSNSSSIKIAGNCSKDIDVKLTGTGNSAAQIISCSQGTYFATVTLTDGEGSKEIIATQVDSSGIVSTVTLTFQRTSFIFQSWPFTTSSSYIFNAKFIEINGGKAKLKSSDQNHNDFSAGTHAGTIADSTGFLTLSSATSTDTGHATSWTPQFSSILGYWGLDGSANDSGPNNTNGNIQGNTSFSTSAKVATHAGEFDGNGDYIDIASSITNINLDSGSLSMWVKREFTTIPATQRVAWRLYANANNFYSISCQDGGKLGFTGKRNSNAFAANTSANCLDDLPAETWVHVGAIWSKSANQTKLYLDGKLISTSTLPDSFVAAATTHEISMSVANQGWLGKLDDVAIFNTVLSAGDIQLIFHRQKQKRSGVYTSEVIDLGQSGSWSSFTPKTPLPFAKETLAAGQELSTSYSAIDGTSVSNGLIALWKFNESAASSVPIGRDFQEYVNNNHAKQTGGVKFGNYGVSNAAVALDGTNDSISTNSATNISTAYNDDFSISLWIKPNWQQVDTGSGINSIMLRRGPAGQYTAIHLQNQTSGNAAKLTFSRFDGTNTPTVSTTTLLTENRFYHIVATKQGTTLSLFLDGNAENTATDTSSVVVNMSGLITFGNDDSNNYFAGQLDDAAIWTRALTSTQIQQLYRRSANRIRYQVRSCDDSLCDSETWIGSSATTSFLSELQNSSTTGANFNLSGLPTAPVSNRYFQYRVILEAEKNTVCNGNTPCFPQLNSVEIGPSGRVYAGNPAITNAVPVSFSALQAISFFANSDCTATYQLSADGSSFYYWNGSAWAVSGSDSEASNGSDITANISSFPVTGSLKFKAFLKSDGTKACELDSISVTIKK